MALSLAPYTGLLLSQIENRTLRNLIFEHRISPSNVTNLSDDPKKALRLDFVVRKARESKTFRVLWQRYPDEVTFHVFQDKKSRLVDGAKWDIDLRSQLNLEGWELSPPTASRRRLTEDYIRDNSESLFSPPKADDDTEEEVTEDAF